MDINEDRLRFCREKLQVLHTVRGRSMERPILEATALWSGGTGIEATDAMEALKHITRGDMPTVVIDATGSLRAIENSFQYMAHGARYVLVGLQKGDIRFSHPEFHKREGTLMSSRNATRADFVFEMESMRRGLIDPST